MMLNKEAIISCLIDKKICTKEEMEGCSLENVEMLEKNASLSLPLQYREFLLGIGRGAGVQTCALPIRSEEHTSELQSLTNLVCRLLLEKKKQQFRSDRTSGTGNSSPCTIQNAAFIMQNRNIDFQEPRFSLCNIATTAEHRILVY